eukprot:TRINITY_DN27308_c0_g1_i1.p1 TRINITY_DN27308_c0_g1~~TRINITY_DN27308_c0_g1_i1.p1  ORF type:complete len:473 (+),score=77.01 TRINITY_DN27308_c0_g1_i1:65-1483(+)
MAPAVAAASCCAWCNKDTKKLLRCSRCGITVYCSPECQRGAWSTHKKDCKPRPSAANSALPPSVGHASNTASVDAASAPTEVTELVDGDDEEKGNLESASVFRKRLLLAAHAANVRMVEAMQEAGGDPSEYLAPLFELKLEYEREIGDRLWLRRREEAQEAAVQMGKTEVSTATASSSEVVDSSTDDPRVLSNELMGKVMTACLRRCVPEVVKEYLLDLANNHFAFPIMERVSPGSYALPKDQVEGFQNASARVCGGGFCCVDGLLDEVAAKAIFQELTRRHWDARGVGGLSSTSGTEGGFGYWLPYPVRSGYSAQLQQVLTVLFGLPCELERAGYPQKLAVPTMVYVGCLPPGASEPLHLDDGDGFNGPCFSGLKAEITMVLFCNPGWEEAHGGAVKAHLTDEGACDPSAGRRLLDTQQTAAAEVEANCDVQEFFPEAGRCLIFRTRECWHEVLTSSRMRFALTLWVGRAD